MNKTLLALILSAATCLAFAQEFENAETAVTNMRIGWNAGNRLDSNSGDVNNMWIEAWTDKKPVNYETAWGQPVITRELIHMFKQAGFNAIRVPVTWYPHVGTVKVNVGQNANGDWVGVWDMNTWTGYTVDEAWMKRVKEVVDYVIDEGMYCVLNVHHDTGDGSTAWLRADEAVYESQKERFESLWTQIATEFRDYDQHLLFEGYNEMLDSYGSWCFASFAAPGNYNTTVAKSAYNAINHYAHSFVNAVRATGGNNAERNLIVSTYGACCGEGTWNSHLADPLKEMVLPQDNTDGHIIFEVHSYPTPNSNSEAKTVVENLLNVLKQHLKPKGAPIIIGEWGIGGSSAKPYFNTMAEYLVKRCKQENIATFLWMVVADGDDCKVPRWSDEALKDAIVKGYYGEEGYNSIPLTINNVSNSTSQLYNLDGTKATHKTSQRIYFQQGKKIIDK